MKPLPPPNIPGNTEAEKFDNAVRKMFSVSKEDVLKAEKKWKRAQAVKRGNARNGYSSKPHQDLEKRAT